jgi:hypothetical protein
MGVVAEEGEYRVIVHSRDHDPPHAHVRKGGSEALGNDSTRPFLLAPCWMAPRDAGRALRLVAKYQAKCLAEWEKLHG